MTITLELSPDAEKQLRERATNQYAEAVRHLLTEALAPSVDATVDALLLNPLLQMIPRSDRLTDNVQPVATLDCAKRTYITVFVHAVQ